MRKLRTYLRCACGRNMNYGGECCNVCRDRAGWRTGRVHGQENRVAMPGIEQRIEKLAERAQAGQPLFPTRRSA